MEKNASSELSLAPEPEQSQDCMDSCSQGILNELFSLVIKGWDHESKTNDGVRFCDL